MTYLQNDDVTRYLMSQGHANAAGRIIGAYPTHLTDAFATGAITMAAHDGYQLRCLVDAVVTLPAASAATRGMEVMLQCGALSAGTGLSADPAAADAIFGAGLTAVVNKDLINTGATDVLGDYVKLRCTGIAGVRAWEIVEIRGIWAKEA